MRLEERVALITGGTSGMGWATAVLFAKEGARVAVVGRNEDRGRQVVGEIESAGGQGIFIRCDVRLADDCSRTVRETERAFGAVDILFNNAGVYYPRTVPDCTEEEWDLTIDTSLVQVSPPDDAGYVSMGITIGISKVIKAWTDVYNRS